MSGVPGGVPGDAVVYGVCRCFGRYSFEIYYSILGVAFEWVQYLGC